MGMVSIWLLFSTECTWLKWAKVTFATSSPWPHVLQFILDISLLVCRSVSWILSYLWGPITQDGRLRTNSPETYLKVGCWDLGSGCAHLHRGSAVEEAVRGHVWALVVATGCCLKGCEPLASAQRCLEKPGAWAGLRQTPRTTKPCLPKRLFWSILGGGITQAAWLHPELYFD